MRTFSAKFYRSTETVHSSHVGIVERELEIGGQIVRVHDRNNYTISDAAITASWLNERTQGYPRNEALEHLYNGRG